MNCCCADVHRRDAHGGLLRAASPDARQSGQDTRSTNWMASSTIIGEKSSPPVFHGGSSRRTGREHRLGERRRIGTTGLRGSGLTHEMRAAAMMIQV